MPDLTTPGGVVAYMSESTSDEDWNQRCDDVYAANDGYPSFWFESVTLPKLADKVLGRRSSDIHFNDPFRSSD